MTKFVKAARVSDITPGQKRVVEVDGMPVMLVNLDGQIYAMDDLCTHDGGPLAEGKLDTATGQIICPRHGARFDVRTGDALTLPAFEPVNTYEVKIEGEDILVESY
jgi:3-phenylpropionate/trans-cinnamate dioxygenase ferredoxin subunit